MKATNKPHKQTSLISPAADTKSPENSPSKCLVQIGTSSKQSCKRCQNFFIKLASIAQL